MKYYFCVLLFFVSGGLSHAQYIFNYKDFSKVQDVFLEDNAKVSNSFVVLTPPETGQKGGLWHQQKVKVKNGFSTSFSFRMQNGGISHTGDAQSGADGIAFLIHNNQSATGVGGIGGGMGFEGVPNSIAIEFDNWQNDEANEPNDNHVAIHTLGTAPNTSAARSIVAMNSNLPTILENGKMHDVRIEYAEGVLQVFLDKKKVISHTIDIAKTLQLDKETAWIGFTASTGAAYCSQEIHTWQFKGDMPPPKTTEIEKPKTLENRTIIGKKVIEVRSRKITLQVWDKGVQDGDIISLNLNNKWIIEKYELKKNKKSIDVYLEDGDNLLVLHALNLGKIPPNTVVLTVIDGKRTHQTLLNSNLKASDSVEIKYKAE